MQQDERHTDLLFGLLPIELPGPYRRTDVFTSARLTQQRLFDKLYQEYSISLCHLAIINSNSPFGDPTDERVLGDPALASKFTLSRQLMALLEFNMEIENCRQVLSILSLGNDEILIDVGGNVQCRLWGAGICENGDKPKKDMTLIDNHAGLQIAVLTTEHSQRQLTRMQQQTNGRSR